MRWTHVADEVEAFVRSCSGAIMVGPHDRATYDRVYALGIPVVRTGWLDALEQVDFVGGTDHEAGSAVARYLVGLGHRSIAYVHGTPGYRGRIERYYGVREVLERMPEMQFREMTFEPEVRFTEHLRAVQVDGFQPTAFFCAHDGLAVTAVSELLRLGYRIPEDVSVIGYGDYSAATQISPRLTTVSPRGQQIGCACVRLLDDRINNRIERGTPIRVLVGGRIVERDFERSTEGPRNNAQACGTPGPDGRCWLTRLTEVDLADREHGVVPGARASGSDFRGPGRPPRIAVIIERATAVAFTAERQLTFGVIRKRRTLARFWSMPTLFAGAPA